MPTLDIFVVPIRNQYLLYSPLHSFAAVVDKYTVREILEGLGSNQVVSSGNIVGPVIEILKELPIHVPLEKEGPITSPLFLGLITTRNCNMGCVYCDFAAPKTKSPVMDLKLAKQAVDAYLALLTSNNQQSAQIHFFGGEPFAAKEVIDFVVNYGIVQSYELGIEVHFEVITNGLFPPNRAYWIGSNFDTVILSLDGPPDIQNRNRPGLNGKELFDTVFRSAKILSHSPAELIIRSCVTDDMVDKIPTIASWIASEFHPSAWCVEPLTQSSSKQFFDLVPPDPWRFAVNFDLASQVLASYGIELINSSVELGNPKLNCCPVGQDALIVSPEGSINACYLLENDWVSKGMNLRFGTLDTQFVECPVVEKIPENSNFPAFFKLANELAEFHVDSDALQKIRRLNVNHRPLCHDCLCRYNCTGGCIVNHNTYGHPGEYDDLCIYTRLVTFAKLLRSLGQEELVLEWLADKPAMENSVWRKSDRLLAAELDFS